MNRLLPFFLLLISGHAFAQPDFLFIKKGGKKKRTFTYGDGIDFKLNNGDRVRGRITGLRNDTIFLGQTAVPRTSVKSVFLHEKKKKPFPVDGKTALLIGGGVGLTTIGLSLNGNETPQRALIAGLAIGYGPLLIKHFFNRLLYALSRKQFRMGKKFRLQVFDVYLPPQKAF